jgi:hypothetical protein
MRLFTVIFFLFINLTSPAQVSFKTIVPSQPVAQGESFQVQYVLTGAASAFISQPVFPKNIIRVVSGPNEFTGTTKNKNGLMPVKNIVYTLEIIKKGRFAVPGTSAVINGTVFYSNNATVAVLSKEEVPQNRNDGAAVSDYFLRPGEDPYQKIKQNLFVKVTVDKRSCFVGEPVMATFKLYSRLPSKSDIVKNPGFYGFSVYDMENLESKITVNEKINGKDFDVHTIRRVQLFPLQEGSFLIDPMMIKNKVAFLKSAVSKKAEQEIAEGMLGHTEETPDENTVEYESNLTTEEITIAVKPLPVKNKPASFTGATGVFTIEAYMEPPVIRQNEQGFLNITIKGDGNFIQIDAPTVQWPPGMEAFPPTIIDDFDKTKMPLSGSRTFRYPVVCAAAGSYKIPPVGFSFFNKAGNSYSQIASAGIIVSVTEGTKKEIIKEDNKESINEQGEKTSRRALFIVLAIVAGVLLFLVFKKKERPAILQEPVKPVISIDEILQPVNEAVEKDSKGFYSLLHKAIWQFASQKFELAGSEQNKNILEQKLIACGAAITDKDYLLSIIEECETGMFTLATMEPDRNAVVEKVTGCLEKINR